MSFRHAAVSVGLAILNELLVAVEPGGVCDGTWVGGAGHAEREGTGMRIGMRMGMGIVILGGVEGGRWVRSVRRSTFCKGGEECLYMAGVSDVQTGPPSKYHISRPSSVFWPLCSMLWCVAIDGATLEI